MNNYQNKILFTIIFSIAGMLLYPPFQVTMANGSIFNMGYSWIFEPPKKGNIGATVNVAMLMAQWIGILLIGGISFFLTKTDKDLKISKNSKTNFNSVPNPILGESQSGIHSDADVIFNKNELDQSIIKNYYETAIGKTGDSFYLRKFLLFDGKGPGGHNSWNWAAFFFTGFWSLYRRMYGWFFIWWLAVIILGMINKTEINESYLFIYLLLSIIFGIRADSLYHRNIKSHIAKVVGKAASPADVNKTLQSRSNVGPYILFFIIGVAIIGILAAIALPIYRGHETKKIGATSIESEEGSKTDQSVNDPLGLYELRSNIDKKKK